MVRIETIPVKQTLKQTLPKLTHKRDHLHSEVPAPPDAFSDLKEAIDSINFHIASYPTGAMPASTNPSSGYRNFAWTRDMALKAFALSEIGDIENATKAVNCLARFYGRFEERGRFTAFLWDKNPKSKYKSPDNFSFPQIRAWINGNGEMVESTQNWLHNQLDAIGMWLWVTFKLANEDKIKLGELDKYLKESVNHQNGEDSIFSVALSCLNRIEFWDQVDVGSWEDFKGHKRASSIGICLSAFKEAYKYFQTRNWNSIKVWNESLLKSELENGIKHGEIVLKERIPNDRNRKAVETDYFPSDAALTFLLYPFNPGLTEEQEKAIINTLNDNTGEVGIRRRHPDWNDNYVGMDYIYNPKSEGIYSDTSLPGYKAAQWTLFDPLIAAYYYKKFSDSNGSDTESLLLAHKYAERAIAQITKEKDSYTKSTGEHIKIEQGIIPEAYWFDSHEQRWRANENSPLLMAEAAFLLMLKEANQALILQEQNLAAA